LGDFPSTTPLGPHRIAPFLSGLLYGAAAHKSIAIQRRLTVNLVEPGGNKSNVESEEKEIFCFEKDTRQLLHLASKRRIRSVMAERPSLLHPPEYHHECCPLACKPEEPGKT
jgi:hypothetical protein